MTDGKPDIIERVEEEYDNYVETLHKDMEMTPEERVEQVIEEDEIVEKEREDA